MYFPYFCCCHLLSPPILKGDWGISPFRISSWRNSLLVRTIMLSFLVLKPLLFLSNAHNILKNTWTFILKSKYFFLSFSIYFFIFLYYNNCIKIWVSILVLRLILTLFLLLFLVLFHNTFDTILILLHLLIVHLDFD